VKPSAPENGDGDERPWVAPDGTQWLRALILGDWLGWRPGDDGLLVLTEEQFRAKYPSHSWQGGQ
jgi:hypothetical protein